MLTLCIKVINCLKTNYFNRFSKKKTNYFNQIILVLIAEFKADPTGVTCDGSSRWKGRVEDFPRACVEFINSSSMKYEHNLCHNFDVEDYEKLNITYYLCINLQFYLYYWQSTRL